MLESFLGLYIQNGEQRKKGNGQSIALKAKKEYSDDETSTSESDDEEYSMAIRNFKMIFRRKSRFVRQLREKKKSSGKGMIRKARVIGNVLDAVIRIISLAKVQILHGTRNKKAFVGGCSVVAVRMDHGRESDNEKDLRSNVAGGNKDLRSDVAAGASSKLTGVVNRSQKGSDYTGACSKHPSATNSPLNGSRSVGNVTRHAKVKRKFSMEEKTIVWEVETDFASPLKPTWDDVADIRKVDDLKQSNDVGNILHEETVGASGTNVKRIVVATASSNDGVQSIAHDVNGSSLLMKKGSYASVINASAQVNSTNNKGFNGGVHSGTTHFESQVTKKVNFRSLVNEERVYNYDTVLPMLAMKNVKNRHANSLIKFVRALVEINVDFVLEHKVSIAIPMEDGTRYTRERVNYLDTPSDKYTNIVREHVNASTVCTNSDGFTKVKRKKNKGKEVDLPPRSRHIDGNIHRSQNPTQNHSQKYQASIQNLKTKFDRLADKQSGRPSGSLPSNTQPNLKGHNSKAYQPPQALNEHVNVVFTRSGKSYNPPVNPNDQQENYEILVNFDIDDEDDQPTPQPKTQNPKPAKETLLPKPYKLKILYPRHLRKEKMEAQYGKFLDMIHAIRINIPLIDVLAGMPNNGKFLKELISKKHKIEQIFAAFLSDESSTMIQTKLHPNSEILEAFLFHKQLNLGVGTERMIFNIDSAMKHSYSNDDTCFSIDVIDEILEDFDALLDEGSKILHSIEGTLLEEEIFTEFDEFMAMTVDENSNSESDTKEPPFEKITINTNY
nr:reverse transcriptase domain-containing protein [Tanacetum cinerariifolium]GEV05226.1 reverse transcriptase domain-containing protein [Tanacetum cinerariifolium]